MSREMQRQLLASFFSFGAYVPWAIGGWQHPEEINIATYGAWALLAVVLTYSARKQNYEVWFLTLGFFVGNSLLFAMGLMSMRSTFNLGWPETIVLYGLIGAVGFATFRWFQGHAEDVPRVLFLGAVVADILSFWPQLKQYLAPHEEPTLWLLMGYGMALCGIMLNLVLVEHFASKFWMNAKEFEKKFGQKKNLLQIFEQSFFSLENVIILPALIFAMAR